MQNIIKNLTLSKKEIFLWFLGFSVLTLSFLPLITNFTWGNHDWLSLKTDGHLKAGFIEGRISQYLFLYLFLDSHILPILNTGLGFLIYSLTIVLFTTRFFEFDINNKKIYFIIPLIASLPYTNEITFFQFIILSQLIWTFTIFMSLMFAKKATKKHHIIYTILSTFFLFLSIGGYPASSNLFIISLILYLSQIYSSTKNITITLKKSIPFIVSLFISFTTLYFTYKYLQNTGQMIKLYNNETISLQELILNLPKSFMLSITSLITPQPFFSLIYKTLSSFIIFSFIFYYLKQSSSLKDFLIRLLFFFAIILGIKFSALLTKETPQTFFATSDPVFFMIRTDFYSLPILILFSLCFLTKNTKTYIKNIISVVITILIFSNINSNLYYSKINILAFRSEINLTERISDRIKKSPNYNPNTLYTLIQATDLSFRPRFYHKPIPTYQAFYTLHSPFTRYWIPNDYYNFYAIQPFVSQQVSINPKDINDEMINYFTNQIETWPSSNSVYLDNKYAIITLSPKGKNMLTEQFKSIKSIKQ